MKTIEPPDTDRHPPMTVAVFAHFQKLCTCTPARTGDRYTSCPDNHEPQCRYRLYLPLLAQLARAGVTLTGPTLFHGTLVALSLN